MESITPTSAKPRFALLPIFLIVTVDILGLTLVLPILPFYAEHYGASPQTVGLLVTIYALCQLLSGPILGRLSDRTGRKPMLLVSQLGTCLGFILLARSHALWMIFLSRFIDGITAGNLPIAQAYISDVTEPQNRAKAFGVIGIAFGVSFFLGPAISGYLSQYGFATPAWAAAGLSLTSMLCTYFLLPSVKSTNPSADSKEITADAGSVFNFRLYWKYFNDPALGPLLFQFLFFGLAFADFMSGFALFAERRFIAHGHPFGAREIGYYYTYLGFLAIITQGYLLPRLVKRFGETRLVVSGFFAQALGYGSLALVHRIPPLMGVAIINSLGSGILRPALTSLISQRASRGEQGTVMGIGQSLVSVGQVLAPILAGFLIGRHFLNYWALSAGLFSLCGFGLVMRPAKSPAT
jgi:DHA1 family tetracycline resistance protein-like MFS transporter